MLATLVFLILYFGYIQNIKNKIKALEEKVAKLEGVDIEYKVEKTEPITYTQPIVPVETQPVSTHSENFGSILAKLGIAILILGIGFFFNYINNKGLISYNVKFILGLIAGGSMIGVAEYLRKNVQKYAEIVRGGGFVVWFLSIFVGSMIYEIFPTSIALVLTAGVVTISFLVSFREKSETTFFIGTLGGYLVPLVAGFYVSDALSTVQLLWYISVISIGIILVSKYMDWMKSVVIGFVFSWLVIFSLYEDMGNIGWQIQWLFTTICALTYLIVFIFGDIKKSRVREYIQASVFLTVLNTCIYSTVAYYILYETVVAPYIGFLVAVLAVVHFLVYMSIQKITNSTQNPSGLTHLVLAIALITAAVPLQLDGPIVTMIWFVEGVIISYLATLKVFKGNIIMYVLGMISIVAGIMHMNIFGEYLGVRDGYTAIYNQKYIVWLFVIVLTQYVAYIWKISVSDVVEGDSFKKNVLSGVVFLQLLVQVCFMGLTAYEIQGSQYFKYQEIYKEERTKLNELDSYYGYYNVSSNLTEEYITQNQNVQENTSIQIESVRKNHSLMYVVFFTIMTVIYLLIGLLKNNRLVRRLGIVTLAITLVQLFSLAWSLGPVFRIASFVGIGIVLLVVSYLYIKYGKKKVDTNSVGVLMIFLTMFACAGVQVSAEVADVKEWSHINTFTEPKNISDSSWYVSSVDSSVWTKSKKQDYGDIRIVNSSKEEIPYIIVKQGFVAKTEVLQEYKDSPTKIVENTLIANKGMSERVLVLDTGKEGKVYTGLFFDTLSTSKNFRKSVRVYVSDTLLGATSPSWREVEQKNVVFNYTDALGFMAEDLEIDFPNMASRYIKIQFNNDVVLQEKGVSFSNQIYVSKVYVKYEQKNESLGFKVQNYISGNFNFSSDTDTDPVNVISKKVENIVENIEKKSTEIYLHDARAITSIKLNIGQNNTNFNRDITVQGSNDATSWQTVTTNKIHRIDSPIYTGEIVTIPTPVITYPYIRIIIQNKNDTALQIKDTVDITEQKIGIIFKAEGVDVRSLSFLIGNKKAISPTYEIQKTLAYFNNIIPTQVSLQKIEKNPVFIEEEIYVPFGEKYKNLVNSALVVFVLLLGYLGYTWTRKS